MGLELDFREHHPPLARGRPRTLLIGIVAIGVDVRLRILLPRISLLGDVV